MYLELAGTTAESFATYLAAHPENTLPLLQEIKTLNVNSNVAKDSATTALNSAQNNIDKSLAYFRYVHDAKGLGVNNLTFVASDGLQVIKPVFVGISSLSSQLTIIPITVSAGSDD